MKKAILLLMVLVGVSFAGMIDTYDQVVINNHFDKDSGDLDSSVVHYYDMVFEKTEWQYSPQCKREGDWVTGACDVQAAIYRSKVTVDTFYIELYREVIKDLDLLFKKKIRKAIENNNEEKR